MILAADLAAVEYPRGNLQRLGEDLSFNGSFLKNGCSAASVHGRFTMSVENRAFLVILLWEEDVEF